MKVKNTNGHVQHSHVDIKDTDQGTLIFRFRLCTFRL